MSVLKKLLGNARWATYSGRLYVGIDALVQPPVLTLVDDGDYRLHERTHLDRKTGELIEQLRAAGNSIAGVIVLAGREHYWLVDELLEAGLPTHLLTPAELRAFCASRNLTERHDAFWVAHLLRARVLSQGEVYHDQDYQDVTAYPHHFRVWRSPLRSRLKIRHPRAPEFHKRSSRDGDGDFNLD